MKPEILKALKGSIEKWEAIVAGTGEDKGAKNCPLCRLFLFWDDKVVFPRYVNKFYPERKVCNGCPVYEATGQPYCDGTPYEKYSEPENENDLPEHAKEELKFLKSLLPENDE